MRRPWIKIETATPDKPEICAIATTLRLDTDAVLGKLVRLWSWVEVNRVAANDLGVTREFLDKLVGRKGFASSLIACGWLTDADGRLGLPNLDRHNGGSAKIRALTAQRVALHRERKHIATQASVSEALPAAKAAAKTRVKSNNAKRVLNTSSTLINQGNEDGTTLPDTPMQVVTSVEEVVIVHTPTPVAPAPLSADEFLAGDVPRFEESASLLSAAVQAETEPSTSESIEPQESPQTPAPTELPTPPLPAEATIEPPEEAPTRKRRARPNPEPNPDQPLLF